MVVSHWGTFASQEGQFWSWLRVVALTGNRVTKEINEGSELIIEIKAEGKLTDTMNKKGKQNKRNVGKRGNLSGRAI